MNERIADTEVAEIAAVREGTVGIEGTSRGTPPASCWNTHPMAHLWQRDETTDAWSPVPLASGTTFGGAASFEAARTPEGATWVVLGSTAVWLNGSPLDVGIAALHDRDEIRVGAERCFFTTEQLAGVTVSEGGERPTFCPRCKLAIAAGTSVVRCPACKVLYHQSDEFPCWTYAPRCAMCDQPTAFDAGYRWSPEGL